MKVGTLNVSCLWNKLNYPEFLELVSSYDVFCAAETYLDSFDIADIENFDFISLPRSQEYKRKSGGIGIYVRSSLSMYIKVESCSSEYILWVSVDRPISGLQEKLMLGTIYIPPENSRFFTQDEFDSFENSVSDACCNHKYVIITCDANSKTAQLSDFVRSDTFLFDMFDVDSVDQSDLEKYTELENLNIPLDRKSKDKKTNAHGIRFIDICRNNDLFFLNGRLYNDTDGNFTFKQKSVIDYVIATADCFKHVRGFNIVETDTFLSDGHSILQFELGSLRLLNTETPSTY